MGGDRSEERPCDTSDAVLTRSLAERSISPEEAAQSAEGLEHLQDTQDNKSPQSRERVRAVLVSSDNRLMLIRRTKAGVGEIPYFVFPGGGVEAEDRDHEAALLRELREELGAEADVKRWVASFPGPGGPEHFYAVRLLSWDVTKRYGPEFVTGDGAYEPVLVDLDDGTLAMSNILPEAMTVVLRHIIRTQRLI